MIPERVEWAVRGEPAQTDFSIAYIGGEGRSGSTLLAAILGNYAPCIPVGEFRDIWNAVLTDELCGCGVAFSKCGFWTGVGQTAFSGWSREDARRMLDLDTSFARHRRLPKLLAMSRSNSVAWSADFTEYADRLLALYDAVARVSGRSIIVDSTKDITYLLILRRILGGRVRVVHLVRDSRGVSYSWSKRGFRKPEYPEESSLAFMPVRGQWYAALVWELKNLLYHLLVRPPKVLTRYEELVESPTTEVRRILNLMSVAEAAGGQPRFEGEPFHTVGGNPVRFQRGELRLRSDAEWRTKMDARQRLLVTVLTWPLLMYYRYVPRRRGRALKLSDGT